MKKAKWKTIAETLADHLNVAKASHKIHVKAWKNKNSRLAEKLEEEKKTSAMWRQSYTVDGEKLEAALRSKDHYYGRVKTLKNSLEKQAKEKDALQRELTLVKRELHNLKNNIL